jgi:hypothetical protein
MSDFHSDLKHIKKCFGSLYGCDIEFALESLDDIIHIVGLLAQSHSDRECVLNEIINRLYVYYHYLNEIPSDCDIPDWLADRCGCVYDSLQSVFIKIN